MRAQKDDNGSVANALAGVRAQLAPLRLSEKTEIAAPIAEEVKEVYGHVLAVLEGNLGEMGLLEPLVATLARSFVPGKVPDDHLVQMLAALVYVHFCSSSLLLEAALFYSQTRVTEMLAPVLSSFLPLRDVASFARQYRLHKEVTCPLAGGFLRLVVSETPTLLGLMALLEALAKAPVRNADLYLALYAFLEYMQGSALRAQMGTLFLLNGGLIETLLRLKEDPAVDDTNRKALLSIMALVVREIVPLHLSGKYSVDMVMKLAPSELHSTISLQYTDKTASVHFLLEFLDLSGTLDFAEDTHATNLLVVSLANAVELGCENRLFHAFNACNTRISLSVLLANLNYIVAASLLDFVDSKENIPHIVRSNFAQLTLPALARPKHLFATSPKDAYGNDLSLSSTAHNLENALYAVALGLKSLSKTLKADFTALSMLNSHSTDHVNLKLVFGLLDLVFSSLTTSLMCVEILSPKEDPSLDSVRTFAYACFESVLSLKLLCTDPSMMWVSLINFANDVCFSDVSYVGLFDKLFFHLVEASSAAWDVLNDKLARGGLEFFVESFGDGTATGNLAEKLGHQSRQLAQVEMDPEEFRFLHSAEKAMPLNAAPLQVPVQALVMAKPYAVNHSRQQSVHVDQYGK